MTVILVTDHFIKGPKMPFSIQKSISPIYTLASYWHLKKDHIFLDTLYNLRKRFCDFYNFYDRRGLVILLHRTSILWCPIGFSLFHLGISLWILQQKILAVLPILIIKAKILLFSLDLWYKFLTFNLCMSLNCTKGRMKKRVEISPLKCGKVPSP